VNRAIVAVATAPALEPVCAFIRLEGPLEVLMHCTTLLVVPSQPAVERARGDAVGNAFEWHSAGNHLRTQLSLDIPGNRGPELITEFGVLISAGPAEVAGLLSSARTVVAAGTSTKLSVTRTPVTADALGRLRHAETGCFVALYLVSLIESQLSVSVCHDT